MAVHLSAASCADWAARQMGLGDAAALFALAETAPAGSGEALFLPYLSGERTPHNDPHARAAFLGLSNATTSAELAATVLEGVAFVLADGLDVLRQARATVAQLSVIGGGARSRYWGNVFAAALAVPLVYRSGGDVSPAFGAAKLAQLALSGGAPGDVLVAPPVLDAIEPDRGLADRLAPKRARFRAAYPSLLKL